MAFFDCFEYFQSMKRRSFTVPFLFVVPLLIFSTILQANAAQTNLFFNPLRASQLAGMTVEDTDGAKAGTLRNLIIDLRDGKMKYAVVGSAGILGLRSTLKIIPSYVMSAATTKRDTLAITISTPEWNNAPSFKSSHLSDLAKPDQAEQIAAYFKNARSRAGNSKLPALTGTGRDTVRSSATPDLRFASDLIGRRVMNEKQEKIGDISDVLIQFGPSHQAFAIISGGRFFHRESRFVVPLDALRTSASGGRFILNMDAAELQAAKPFNREAWNQAATNSAARAYLYSPLED